MADMVKLRSRLMRKPIVVAPGVYDAFTALVAEQSGFRTLYVSGAAISYTRLGRPDIGLVSMSEVGNLGKENPRMEKLFDLVIKKARVVRPNKTSVDCLDIAVKEGKIARLAPDIQAEQAKQVFDAKNLLAFPGCVDAHMHIGIYAPLAQDAVSESKAAAIGGV